MTYTLENGVLQLTLKPHVARWSLISHLRNGPSLENSQLGPRPAAGAVPPPRLAFGRFHLPRAERSQRRHPPDPRSSTASRTETNLAPFNPCWRAGLFLHRMAVLVLHRGLWR